MVRRISPVKDSRDTDVLDAAHRVPSDPAFYETRYLELNPTLHEEDVEDKFQALRIVLQLVIPKLYIRLVGDIGCGSCSVLVKALDYLCQTAHKNIRGLGIDISSRILSLAKQHPNVSKVTANCEEIPLKNRSVSLGICFDVVEHVRDPRSLVREVARISRFAVFRIPLELSLYTRLNGNKGRLTKLRRQYGHIHHFSRSSAVRLIRAEFDVLFEDYAKIPNRCLLFDKLQDMLIRADLNQLFASLFGGFVILLVSSKATRTKT